MDTKKKRKEKKSVSNEPARENIWCRHCFMVDGYRAGEDKCAHCGAKIYRIDHA